MDSNSAGIDNSSSAKPTTSPRRRQPHQPQQQQPPTEAATSSSIRSAASSNTSTQSATLLRLQQETDRVKQRLTQQQLENRARAQQQQQQQPPPTNYLIIEPTESAHYEDPVPANQMSSHLKSKHEAFKARLIDDVLGTRADDKVPMEKVVMLIWQFRDDPQVVKFMTKFVAKYAGSRHVFEGIEFYLPQLAHMIIHLEVEWDDAILERFALVIGQQSLHFALQLNWILQGAIEDYQPELPNGEENPNYNPLFYSRCIKLLTNLERCVVYKRPRSQELQRLYEKGKITKAEFQTLEQADRRFAALQITQLDDEDGDQFGGTLLYKRSLRTSCLKAKRWKQRYFCVEERMLNCYNKASGPDRRMIRSMPLEGAQVQPEPDSKYENMFSVVNRSFQFRMRASSPEDMKKWITILNDEATSATIFGRRNDNNNGNNNAASDNQLIQDMTPAQRARYEFFRDERDFIRRITDIAEELRFKERDERKKLAPRLLNELTIPPCVYVPLCGSTDTWRRAMAAFHKDTRVFNTKERCPVIMYFLASRGERNMGTNLDVAEYMHKQFDLFDDDGEGKIIEEEGNDDDDNNGDAGMAPSSNGIVANTNDNAKNGGTSERGDDEGSSVWHENGEQTNDDGGDGSSGNRRLQGFLKDSWTSIPRKLASRIEGNNRRPSVLDNATDLQIIPILEGEREHDDEASVGGSSIVSHNKILMGTDQDRGHIDQDSLNRAKQIVSHGESWAEKSFRMLGESAKSHQQINQAQYEVVSLMSKSNDDLRQEVFVMQMIHYYKSVFAKAKLPLWLKTYRILSTSGSTGLIEVLVDATSIDGLKKSDGYPEVGGMRQYFVETYDGPNSKSFKEAQQNFMRSLAAYSLVSYLLGLKDRHNGNIMIDTKGHLIFIDFGFAMGMAPGHEFSMERAPFKFTDEYVEVMGGENSDCYKEFQRLFVEGFLQARANSQIALGLVEIMMYKSNYPCFSGWRYGNGVALRKFEQRLMLDVPDAQVPKLAKALITRAKGHSGTKLYDSFQQWSNGYAI
mmetsp:Transcript_28768/g.81140  ORF Transcript_28768/g.81140 Transcript_28768/m.81140 type:complete len:1026 (-) Transcript_28768:71-3148(-)